MSARFPAYLLLLFTLCLQTGCELLPQKKPKKLLPVVLMKKDLKSNPIRYQWSGTEGEIIKLEVWLEDDETPVAEKVYTRIANLGLTVNGSKNGVPPDGLSGMVYPYVDSFTLSSSKSGEYTVGARGNGAVPWKARLIFSENAYSDRVFQAD